MAPAARIRPLTRTLTALLVVWVIGLAALALVIRLHERADSQRRAEVLVETLRREIGEVPGIVFSASPGQGVRPGQARARLRAADRALDVSFARLDDLDENREADLRMAIDRYTASMARIIPLAAYGGGGDREYGRARAPGGAEFELSRILDREGAEHVREADRAKILTDVGSAAAILLALVAYSLSLRRLLATSRRNEALARTNERLYENSRRESLTDALTGLANRRSLFEEVGPEVDLSLDGKALALFDLDGFKAYNDTFGHPAGDALLRRIAVRVDAVLAGRGTAFRMGGDEFCVITDSLDPEALLEEARRALADRGEGFSIRASMGWASIPTEARTLESALQIADQRLYTEKSAHGEARDTPLAGLQRRARGALLRVVDWEAREETAPSATREGALASATAARLGLPLEQIGHVRLAAELHDIGKAAVPDEVLEKPGPLDGAEWDLAQRHSLIGERILAGIPALADVAPLVRSSHERLDGTGYPDGLRSAEIPVGSRIIAVVDAFGAMVEGRPYRRPCTPQAALEELRTCAGTQFDPRVVEAFAKGLLDLAGEVDQGAGPKRQTGL